MGSASASFGCCATRPGYGAAIGADERRFFGIGMVTSNIWAITQTIARPVAAGQWTGLQNSIGKLGGVISPIVTGWIVSQTGSFYLAFGAASISLLLSALIYGVWLGPVGTVPLAGLMLDELFIKHYCPNVS